MEIVVGGPELFLYTALHNVTVKCSVMILQFSPVKASTVQYSTVQYSTVQSSAVQYSPVQYSRDHRHLAWESWSVFLFLWVSSSLCATPQLLPSAPTDIIILLALFNLQDNG